MGVGMQNRLKQSVCREKKERLYKMPKKYKTTTTTLVIVESPSKCKKIEQYLGPGYQCVATCGHVRELASLEAIDIEHQFRCTYTAIDTPFKRKSMAHLKQAMEKSTDILLATDDDREGEAIAWHVCQVFRLDVSTTKRMVFREITESALQFALQHPRRIDLNVVHAQQARQVLDLLVGFKVSPLLWTHKQALSAGRCQTPALKLIYDNDHAITESKSKERNVYHVIGYFTNSTLAFELSDKLASEKDMEEFLQQSANFAHRYTCSSPKKVYKDPPEPFTTSRLQQKASNELRYAPKETMRICQLLYEAGYITYMRTDSTVYSHEFLVTVEQHLVKTYASPSYFNDKIKMGTNGPLSQEAHEAIRPTNISLYELPEEVQDSKQRRLYKLIWRNSLQSCMTPTSLYSVTATITSPMETLHYRYTAELMDFPGWQIVDNNFSRENKDYLYLQRIQQSSPIPYKKITATVTVQGTKAHYTEARLVQELEARGIGRPSTFSSLVDKIQERGYVKKQDVQGKEIVCKDFALESGTISEIETKREFGHEKSKLVLQPLGMMVINYLDKHFASLFEYDYTKNMEENLDKVAKGEQVWHVICRECCVQVDTLVALALASGHRFRPEVRVDEHHTYVIGQYGPVIKCVEGKEVSFEAVTEVDLDSTKLLQGRYQAGDLKKKKQEKKNQDEQERLLGQQDGENLVLKKGKFGLYVTWGTQSRNLKELGNRPLENVTLNEVQSLLTKSPTTIVREINASMSIRTGPKGSDYIFYKPPKLKKPQFFSLAGFQEDYKICDMAMLKSWIESKYKV